MQGAIRMHKDSQLINWANYLNNLERGKSYKPRYLNYISNLIEYNLPVIFELDHLAMLLGRSKQFVAAVIHDAKDFYHHFEIPKKRGGYRSIDSPYPSLLECQQWLNQHILNKVMIDEAAHGFVKGRSIVTNAREHLGCKELLKIDIKDFFPSIKQDRIRKLFQNIGYAPNVSKYLSSFCTLNGVLPQGAATSPTLSNIIFCVVDEELREITAARGLVYTRYADDIAISGDIVPPDLISQIRLILESHSFMLNDKKTIHIKGKGRKIITGLSVGGEELKIPKEAKRELRKEAHHLITKGFETHSERIKTNNILYIESLLGRLIFWSYVEPDNHYARYSIDKIRKLHY